VVFSECFEPLGQHRAEGLLHDVAGDEVGRVEGAFLLPLGWRFTPSPLVGEGWGGGSSRKASPPPSHSPIEGEGPEGAPPSPIEGEGAKPPRLRCISPIEMTARRCGRDFDVDQLGPRPRHRIPPPRWGRVGPLLVPPRWGSVRVGVRPFEKKPPPQPPHKGGGSKSPSKRRRKAPSTRPTSSPLHRAGDPRPVLAERFEALRKTTTPQPR